MTRPRPGVGWALNMLWRASDAPLPPVLNPSLHFNSAPLVGLAFPVKWGMDTAEYIKRMGFVGSVAVENKGEFLRRISLLAFHETEWHTPQLTLDLSHDGVGVQGCNILVAPNAEPDMAPPQLRGIGAVSEALLNAEAAGQPIHELAQYEEVAGIRRLALSAGSLIMHAASML